MSISGSDGTPDKWGAQELLTPSGTLTWYADLSGLPVSGGASETSFFTELDSAFDIWAEVAAVDFLQTTSSSADITFTVARLEDIAPTLPNIEDAAGLASRSLIPGAEVDRITDVDIYFDTDLTWFLGGNFFKVAAHEIGHGLGLEHIHDPDEIMNPTVFVNELGVQDIAAVQSLYGTGDGGSGDPFDPPPDDGDPVMAASDGGGGGGIGVLALLAAVMAFFFGGAGGGAAVAALGKVDDDDIPDPDYDDLPPMIETDFDLVFIEGHGNWDGHGHGHGHEHGCGCLDCAAGTEDWDDLFA